MYSVDNILFYSEQMEEDDNYWWKWYYAKWNIWREYNVIRDKRMYDSMYVW